MPIVSIFEFWGRRLVDVVSRYRQSKGLDVPHCGADTFSDQKNKASKLKGRLLF